jgi:hypothetical protein
MPTILTLLGCFPTAMLIVSATWVLRVNFFTSEMLLPLRRHDVGKDPPKNSAHA